MVHELIDRLAATPAMLAHLVAEAGDSRLDTSLAGGWTPRIILAHFRDDEFLNTRLALQRLLAEEGPTLTFLDGDAWEATRNRTRDRKEWLLAGFALQRQASVAILGGLRPEDWARAGERPGHGLYTVEKLVSLWVQHDASHLAQLERALGETLDEVRTRRARPE